MLFLCKCMFTFLAGFRSVSKQIKYRHLTFDGLFNGYCHKRIQHCNGNTDQANRRERKQEYKRQYAKENVDTKKEPI